MSGEEQLPTRTWLKELVGKVAARSLLIQALIDGGATPREVQTLIAELQQGRVADAAAPGAADSRHVFSGPSLTAGAAAGRSAGGAEAGGLTPREFLALPLPVATYRCVKMSSASTSQVVHMFEPEGVEEWKHVDPFSTAQGRPTVLEAVVEHQVMAGSIYPIAVRDLHQLSSVNLDSGEASVTSRFDEAVLQPLDRLVASLPLAYTQGAFWKLQAPMSSQMQEELLAAGTGDVIAPQPSTDTPLQKSSSGRVIRPRAILDPSKTVKRSGPLKADFALALNSAQPLPVIGPATAGEQAGRGEASSGGLAMRTHYICVGEAKCIPRLVDMTSGQMAPIELLEAWRNEQHVHHQHARAAIAQVFTYLEMSRACYAFLTCYMATWLMWRSPNHRHTLYVTAPFLSSSHYGTGAGGPTASVKGAMAWLQYEALKNASASLAPFPAGGPGEANSGGGNGGSTGGGGGSNNDNEDDKLPDVGGSANSDSSYRPPGSTSRSAFGAHGEQQQQRGTKPQAPLGLPTRPTLELHRRLCNGSAGLVVVGAVGGTPAVVKLLGPDDEGLDAYEAEVQAYDALQQLQGKVVPVMLAAGYVPSGVHYVAVSHLPGKPLSEVARPLPPDVAQAAVAALQQLHSACSGFLHGDVRLQNIMLLPPGSSGEPARCMVIDFGQARLDGTDQEQGREVKQLERLLQ